MLSNPNVSPHPDGFRATWPGFPKAFALFSIEGDAVIITDIFRDPAQPKGYAGRMLCDALRLAGARRPTRLRIAKILETQLTLAQIKSGTPIAQTVLGQTLANCVDAFGGRPTAWDHGEERGKPWIEASIQY
jgi:hypothetical protein